MLFSVLIVIFGLSFLMILHEFGHFIIAKKFKIKVEEFAIGIPPKVFSKKIGQTIFSLNLIPFGAFVKIYSEEKEKAGKDFFKSYLSRPFWQKALVLFGGVISFWLISYILFIFVLSSGVLAGVGDEDNPNFINPHVQVLGVVPKSPAQLAGIKTGDIILRIETKDEKIESTKEEELRSFIKSHLETPLFLTVQRGKKIIRIEAIPTKNEKGEGMLGIYLQRTAFLKYPFWKLPSQAFFATLNTTKIAFWGYWEILKSIFQKRSLPPGAEIIGPVGIGALMFSALNTSFFYFLQMLATISVFLAIANLLPIPVFDGGQFLFLVIEKMKRKPISLKVQEAINNFFFVALMILMVFITFRDIIRLF